MDFRFIEKEDGLGIFIDDLKDKKEELLKGFYTCQAGQCSCPTTEYNKIESMEIEHSDDSIELLLKSKEGQTIDKEQINNCLLFTKESLEK